jgi:hypothetical protein
LLTRRAPDTLPYQKSRRRETHDDRRDPAICEITGVHTDREARKSRHSKSAPFEEAIRETAMKHLAAPAMA